MDGEMIFLSSGKGACWGWEGVGGWVEGRKVALFY